ncbi:RE1 [Symbiodinium pilosum]|uniref:RE1 protein n=1 Tax=Symbiodinium pilosum TaxID=2952 RepID=A0A812KW75_SYMPI|nr:RE1 [Symbiodinium pilosum]
MTYGIFWLSLRQGLLQVFPQAPRHRCSLARTMSTKADIQKKLQELGEAVPESWTLLQMKGRLYELKEEMKSGALKTLASELKALKKASGKKDNLRNFFRENGLEYEDNWTIQKMFNHAEMKITLKYPPTDSDVVGFGKFGDMTYAAVLDHHPSYCQWIQKTQKESDSPHWRLTRLSTWLTSVDAAELIRRRRALDEFIATFAQLSSAGTRDVTEEHRLAMKELADAQAKIAKLNQEKEELEHQMLESRAPGKHRREAIKQFGADASIRCSLYNGFDLTEKRAYAEAQYRGGIEVAHHAQLCGSELRQTAFYTPVFAKKVVEAMRRQEHWIAHFGQPEVIRGDSDGDLVFYWGRQVAGREKERGFSIGSFVGPARVLAVETRSDEAGNLRPGSCVWLHRAGRLIKAAPEQLRAASEREHAIEELRGPVEIPWTISSLATHSHAKTYDDITGDVPTDMEWEEAVQEPDEDSALQATNTSASSSSTPCFEIEILLPVREKYLSPEEKEQFRQAKAKEVRSFLRAQCFEMVPKEKQPSSHEAVGMRWVLTWKNAEDPQDPSKKKAKARAVVLGYQDDQYEYRQTSSPTVSRTGRQAFLQLCAWRKFTIAKGDVTSAFLQGSELEDDYWVIPDFSITLDQKDYVNDLQVVKLSRDREKHREAPITDWERHQLRAVLGSLSWHTGQTGFQYSADVGILLSSVCNGTVEDIVKTNKLVRDIQHSPGSLKIHSFRDAEWLDAVCWADAAWANRPDGKSSTEGIVLGFSSPNLAKGALAPVSLMLWRSSKIDRTCRSPACAETKGVVNGEDDLYHLRYLWSEINHPETLTKLWHPDSIVDLTSEGLAEPP